MLSSARFYTLLVVSCGVAYHLPRLLRALGAARLSPETIEVVAWMAISLTYCGFLVGELAGPWSGSERDVEGDWKPFHIYLAVMASLGGAVLGLGLLAPILEPAWVLQSIAAFIVATHLCLRRFTTERKLTPHLGQRGSGKEKATETAIGLVSDGLVAGLLLLLWHVTGHPLWIVGFVLFVLSYVLGVTVHRHLDPVATPKSSYFWILAGQATVSLIVVSLTAFHRVSTQSFFGVFAAGAVLILLIKLVRETASRAIRTVAAIAVLSVVFGTLTAGEIQTGLEDFLLNPAARREDLLRYLALVAFLSTGTLLLIAAMAASRSQTRMRWRRTP